MDKAQLLAIGMSIFCATILALMWTYLLSKEKKEKENENNKTEK